MKLLMVMGTALSLGACAALPTSIPVAAPAPLAQTVIDDSALDVAWKSFDAALDGINLLIDAKLIKAGSPKANKIADGVDRVTAALTAAESAAAAGSTTSYKVALAEAKSAILYLRAALKGQ